MHLKVKNSILNSFLFLMGSQWRSFRIGVMWSYFVEPLTTLGALFWTFWSLHSSSSVIPQRSPERNQPQVLVYVCRVWSAHLHIFGFDQKSYGLKSELVTCDQSPSTINNSKYIFTPLDSIQLNFDLLLLYFYHLHYPLEGFILSIWPFQCWGHFCPKHKDTNIFENHLNPVMLAFIG